MVKDVFMIIIQLNHYSKINAFLTKMMLKINIDKKIRDVEYIIV